jgi:hypothetical protein
VSQSSSVKPIPFQPFIHEETPKIILNIPRTATYENAYTAGNEAAVGSTRKLLQYCQMPDKFPTILGIFVFKKLSRSSYRLYELPWSGNSGLDS